MEKAVMRPVAVPDIQYSKSEVFILESLTPKDDRAKRFEGQILSDMLLK